MKATQSTELISYDAHTVNISMLLLRWCCVHFLSVVIFVGSITVCIGTTCKEIESNTSQISCTYLDSSNVCHLCLAC